MTTKKAAGTAVAEKEEAGLPAVPLAGMEQHAGDGFENTTADDYAIPYLSIAHGTSKAMKKNSADYIEELKLGDIYDPVSGEIWDEVRIVPLLRQRYHVEWDDRQFVERHALADSPMDSTTRNEKGHDILPNGNTLIDTVYLYVLIVGKNGVNAPAVISFARTSAKVYKKLMHRANKLRLKGANGKPFLAPLHSHIYTLGTAIETSRNGDDFYNWKLVGNPELISDADLWQEAEQLRAQITSGERTAADPQQAEQAEVDAESAEADTF